eukprot:4929503-Prymnesium_polylepis.1
MAVVRFNASKTGSLRCRQPLAITWACAASLLMLHAMTGPAFPSRILAIRQKCCIAPPRRAQR